MRLYQCPSALALSLVHYLIIEQTSVFAAPLTFLEFSEFQYNDLTKVHDVQLLTDKASYFQEKVNLQWVTNSNSPLDQKSPYYICEQKSNRKSSNLFAKLDIDSSHFRIISNTVKSACFEASILYKDAKSLLQYQKISVTPVFSGMKIFLGTLKHISNGENFGSDLCENSSEQGNKLAQAVSSICTQCNVEYYEDSSSSKIIVKVGVALVNSIVDAFDFISDQPSICSVYPLPKTSTNNKTGKLILQGGQQNGKGFENPFHKAGILGEGQVAQVSDTGVSIGSCFFKDSNNPKKLKRDLSGDVDESQRKIIQYIAVQDQFDKDGHGTHVAGTLLGSNENGPSPHDGVAPAAKLAFYDELNFFTLKKMFTEGLKAKATVHNASWGLCCIDPDCCDKVKCGPLPGCPSGFQNVPLYTQLDKVIDEFSFQNDEFLVFNAAGNDGREINTLHPGSFPGFQTIDSMGIAKNSIAVCSSENFGTLGGIDVISDFSSQGPTFDGRIKPDLCAPGGTIFSAGSVPDDAATCSITEKFGTSMASPGAAGTALLVRQYFQEGFYPSGKKMKGNLLPKPPSASLIKAVLINSGRVLEQVNRGDPSEEFDGKQGFGRISLLDSLPLDKENDISLYVRDREVLNKTSRLQFKRSFLISNCGETNVSVTLVWADFPATAGCTHCLISHLALSAKKGTAQTQFFPNGGNGLDGTNNVQRIRLPVTSGEIVHVKVEVNEGAGGLHDMHPKQEFSLVVSGCGLEEVTTTEPSSSPSTQPSLSPTMEPSLFPSTEPSSSPSTQPSLSPTMEPSLFPSTEPSSSPSTQPSLSPTMEPSLFPSTQPSLSPTMEPSVFPSTEPSLSPTMEPSVFPSNAPSSKKSKKKALKREKNIVPKNKKGKHNKRFEKVKVAFHDKI